MCFPNLESTLNLEILSIIFNGWSLFNGVVISAEISLVKHLVTK